MEGFQDMKDEIKKDQRNQKDQTTLYIDVGIRKLLEFATCLYYRGKSLSSDTNL